MERMVKVSWKELTETHTQEIEGLDLPIYLTDAAKQAIEKNVILKLPKFRDDDIARADGLAYVLASAIVTMPDKSEIEKYGLVAVPNLNDVSADFKAIATFAGKSLVIAGQVDIRRHYEKALGIKHTNGAKKNDETKPDVNFGDL